MSPFDAIDTDQPLVDIIDQVLDILTMQEKEAVGFVTDDRYNQLSDQADRVGMRLFGG